MTRWRAASLIGVHILIGLHFLHWKVAGRTLAPVEPSEMFDTIHLGIITVGFLFMAGLVLATSIAGRFFCSWGCHILALQDLCAAILTRLKIPTKPIRSRTLLWVPSLAVLYLFVWPQIERILRGHGRPSLHVITDPNGWTSFTTTDLLRSFPGLGMTIFTFAVCGFAIVYFLGSRSFCSYACPYGAIFAAADRVAPLRIIAGPGECSSCGLCVSNCKSNVQVINEVREFGTVMNSHCMRDLDCVSVCPTDALKLGVTKPPLFRSWFGARTAKKPYDFSLGEDLLMGSLFLACLVVVRGLYDAVSFLLALALSAILAYFAVVVLRLVRKDQVKISNIDLKLRGSLTSAGKKFGVVAMALGVLVAHSALIRFHVFAGELAFSKIHAAELSAIPLHEGRALSAPSDVEDLASQSLRERTLYHFERAYQLGLFRPDSLSRGLAVAYQLNDREGDARNCLQLQLTRNPDDLESRLLLGHSLLKERRYDLASNHLSAVVEAGEKLTRPSRSLYDRRILAAAHSLLGDLHVQTEDPQSAINHFRKAIEEYPEHADSYMGLGTLLAQQGKLQDAASCLTKCAKLTPNSPILHNNLGAILMQLDRFEDALYHLQQVVDLLPGQPQTHCSVGRVLMRLNRLDEAKAAFQEAVELDEGFAEAIEGLKELDQLRSSSNR